MSTLPTIHDAIAAGDPNMVVEHDGNHDYQTCSRCRRSWGAGHSDYQDTEIVDDRHSVRCPDPNCDGLMGMYASAHIEWEDYGARLSRLERGAQRRQG